MVTDGVNIVVVQETDWIRRGPHQQHHLFERLSRRGHTVTVLDYPILRPHWPREPLWSRMQIVENAARLYDDAAIRLVTPATLGFKPLARISSMFSHYAALRRIIHQHQPDLIVSYALSTGLPALRLARRYQIPFVFHVIDALHAIVPSRALQPIAHRVERWLFSQSNRVVLINEHLRDYAIGMGAQVERTHVLRTGVDLGRIHPTMPDDPARLRVRADLGFQPGDLVLFFMGWLYDFSGVREVARTLVDAPPHVRLLVVGDGDDYDVLCRLRDEHLGPRLVLTGRVPYDRIPAYLAAADVPLLPFHTVPATRHIVPIKLYEYMASGKPVISAPLPGVQRDIGTGNGVIYAPAEEQAATALRSYPDGAKLGHQARAFVEANCDWATITDQFESLLIQTVQNHRG